LVCARARYWRVSECAGSSFTRLVLPLSQ
jgi:hypothetical protein